MAPSNAEKHGPDNRDGSASPNTGNHGDDRWWDRTIEVLRLHLPPYAIILEAGCSYGRFVSAARRAGLIAFGYDTNGRAISQAPYTAQPFVSVGDFVEGPKHEGEAVYDMGCSWEMLDLIDGPGCWEGLKKMRSQIVPGGLMVHLIPLANEAGEPTYLKTRAYWHEVFSDLGLKRRPDIEEELDAKYSDRDWRNRFFAYEV